MDPVRVGLAVQRGVSTVCATCTKYWGARERGLEGDKCLSSDNCGGPIAGDDFHEYSGPISDLSRWCFVCGELATHGVQVNGRPRRIGVCANHVRLFVELRPVGREGQEPQVVIRTPGNSLTVSDLVAPRKKTLAEAIYEVEAYHAKDQEDG